ncbi:MAG: hypothetical protein Q8S13_02725 [Dehalococcoidia bacterium]|nr:hypothetical protein [Dehalococcoidia bacterium]
MSDDVFDRVLARAEAKPSASRAWAIGDAVKVYASPRDPWHGRIGTIVEMHVRRIDGSIRYTVRDAQGRDVYLSEGSLREPPARGIAIEDLIQAPIGAHVTTLDGAVTFRRYGAGKMEWERVSPHPPEGWRATGDPRDRGSRAFLKLTQRLKHEPMVFVVAR